MKFPGLPDPAFCYHLTVPLGSKEWITSNQRLFWRMQADRTKAWREETAALALKSGIRRIERAWVIADVSFADTRRRDPANWYPTAKACVDGMVDAGLFSDDDHRHLIGPDMRITTTKVPKAQRAMTFHIYPLEGSQ